MTRFASSSSYQRISLRKGTDSTAKVSTCKGRKLKRFASRKSSIMRRWLFLTLMGVGVTSPATAGTVVVLDGTGGGSGSNALNTTGDIDVQLGFFADYLVVGGGGSGGTPGGPGPSGQQLWGTGGGGGGGVLAGRMQLNKQSYSIAVGAGGTAPSYDTGGNSTTFGNNGGNSSFDSITALGGGGGAGGEGASGGDGRDGGSGGGGGSKFSNPGGNGTAGQGFAGGRALSGTNETAPNRTAGGGGGGAGGVGGDASGDAIGGNGGAGVLSNINGSAVRYGGGGGGGVRSFGPSETPGVGGSGGGGNGGVQSTAANGTNGLGGGGGGLGADGPGGNGGSGVVIIGYRGGPVAGLTTSGSTRSTTSSGDTVETFSNVGPTQFLNLTNVDMNSALLASAGTITGSGNLTFSGPGTLTLSGANSHTGATRSQSGTLNLGNVDALSGSTLDLATGDLGSVGLTLSGQTYNVGGLQGTRNLAIGDNTISVGANDGSTNYSGALSGTGGFSKVGTGTLALDGANTYSGTTRAIAGTLNLGNVNSLAGSTLDMATADVGTVGLTLSGQTYNIGGLEGTRNLSIGNNTISVGANNGSTIFSGVLSGTGGFSKVGSGTLGLDGANTYSGTTRASTGTLNLGNVNALAGSTLDMATADAGTVGLTLSGQTYNVGGLQGTRNLAIGDNTISVGANNASTSYSGSISGTGGLTKAGGGIMTLTGSNLYTGATTVANGKLVLNGAINSSIGGVTIQNGASLGGNGTIGGATTFLNNSMHTPGNSPGLQNFTGGLTYNTGSTFQWELIDNIVADRGDIYDGVDVSGGALDIQAGVTSELVFNVGSTVDWTDSFWGSNQSWQVFSSLASTTLASTAVFDTITITGDNNSASLASVRAGAFFSWSRIGNDIYLNYSATGAAVPEPGSLALLAAATGVVAARRKFRRKTATAG